MSIEELKEHFRHRLYSIPPREITIDDVSITVKVEYPMDLKDDPLRTIKRKPASVLFYDLLEKGSIKSDRILITASSGNFLRELALLAAEEGYKVIGVTPPQIPSESLKILRALGVDIIHISEEYDLCPRETTVFFTRAFAEKYRLNLVNVDQYSSWQNILSHIYTTWEEIKSLGEFDYLCIPLGSTGTFMGICLMSKLEKSRHKLIGIQPTKQHHIPGVHHIIGDCEWSPEIFSPLIKSEVVTIDDVDAYAGLVMLWKRGIYAGPSSGMTFIHARRLAERSKEGRILVISADGVFAYRDYILKVISQLRDDILKRYPDLVEDLFHYVEWLKSLPSMAERIRLIRSYYKVPAKTGRVLTVDEIVSGEDRFMALF